MTSAQPPSDNTAQPPSYYEEAAAESTSRRFGGRPLSREFFGRDKDRDRNHLDDGNGGVRQGELGRKD